MADVGPRLGWGGEGLTFIALGGRQAHVHSAREGMRLVASIRPFPFADLRHIVPVTRDVLFVLDELVAQKLFEVSAPAL